MTEQEIAERFLGLFSKDWADPEAHRGFRELSEQVSGQGQWGPLIESRLMALDKKIAQAVGLLKEILAREPHNVCASLGTRVRSVL